MQKEIWFSAKDSLREFWNTVTLFFMSLRLYRFQDDSATLGCDFSKFESCISYIVLRLSKQLRNCKMWSFTPRLGTIIEILFCILYYNESLTVLAKSALGKATVNSSRDQDPFQLRFEYHPIRLQHMMMMLLEPCRRTIHLTGKTKAGSLLKVRGLHTCVAGFVNSCV